MEFVADSEKATKISNGTSPKNYQECPKDRFYFDHMLFFFFGLTNLLSYDFFLTANDYWMYKFRDTSQPTYNATSKTDLQIYFASATLIAQSGPNLIATGITALYGHKIHIRTRVLGNLLVCFLMFFAATASVLINTDSWQTVFFYLILVIYSIIVVTAIYFQVCIMTLISKFPLTYTKTQMYGCGSAGIFSAILQIIALALANGSSETAAMIYFTFGTSIIFVTLLLAYLSKYSEHHMFYLGNTQADKEKKVYSKKDIWEATKRTWSCMLIFSVSWSLCAFGHPNVTSLVVSEYYDTGTVWNKKYFVPVVTFLSTDIYSQIARAVGRPIIHEKNQWSITGLFVIRVIILGPIFYFCRTSPKVYSPLWFPHDWQYILVVAINSFFNVYFLAICFLSIPRLAKEYTELAFILQQTYGNILPCITAPIGTLMLKLL